MDYSNTFESYHESQNPIINVVPSSQSITSNKRSSIENRISMKPSTQHIHMPKNQPMLYSTTNAIKKAPEVPSSIKQNSKEVIASEKASQQVFIKYYEENIQLKKKQEDMAKQVRELHEKLNAKNDRQRLLMEEELKALAQGKKAEWDTTKKSVPKQQRRGESSGKNLSTKKVEHLLEIIEHYKKKLVTSEEEVINLRRQKQILEQDIRLRDKRYQSLQDDKKDGGSSFQEEVNISDKLKRNIRELQLQKERNKLLEITVKSLESKLTAAELKLQQIPALKSENMVLEEKVIRMTQLPNFNNVIDKAEEERKAKELERKLKLLNQKYNSLRDNSFKTQADLKILQNKLIESTHEITLLEKENETLRAQSVNNPILQKLNKDPQLIQKVLFEIQQKKKENIREPANSKEKIEKLILEKEELARQILNYQTRIQTLEESFRERQKLSKLQKPEILAQIPSGKTSSKQGVLYDGDSSVFSQQNVNIPAGINYFDLYLGEISLLQTMVQSITGLNNVSSPLLLATVDFYNHNTESSKLAQGCQCDLQSEIFFKVTEDDFFLKYLQKNSFNVDVWASEGSKHYHMGKATIDLRHLISKARPRISPIISSSVPLYLNQKVLGSINIVMRMRLPIYDQVQKLLNNAGASTFQAKEEVTMRRLVIQVDEGRGFGQKSNTFVYFPFRLQDYYTRPSKGNTPNWNFMKMIEINYDTDFKNYLRKSELQFIVFDDNVLVMDDKNMDVLGSAVLPLTLLLQGKAIRQRLEIRKGNQRRGTIDVKLFWYQVEDNNKDLLQLEEQRKLSPQGVHEQIRSFMKEHNVDPQKIFRLMDDNKTGIISFDQFQEWIFTNSSRKFTSDTVGKYYKGFKEPVNLKNFVMRLSQDLDGLSKKEEMAAELGLINQILKTNSTQIKKTPLEDYLQGKNIVEVANNIQTDRTGHISKQKLQEYLDKNGLEASITGDKIKLIDFLRKNKKMNLTL